MTKDEALKMALEALEEAWYHVGTFQPTEKAIDLYDEARAAIKEALAQPEPEYVAFMDVPQRTWVGLTPQERDEINEKVYGAVPHHVAFHHAIEQALREKNT